MKLTSVDIHNFRSIESLQVELDPTCRVLVGINESGKSNILKALASLGSFVPSKEADVREPLPDESPIREAYIKFRFGLEAAETQDITSLVGKEILVRDLSKTPIANRLGLDLVLRSFIEERSTGLYEVDILTQKKKAKYWAIDPQYKLAPGWMKPSETCPAELQVSGIPGFEGLQVKAAKLVYRPDFPKFSDEIFAAASIHDLASVVGTKVVETIEGTLSETVLWEYSDQYLLPPSINIDGFAANPNSCLPLKYMFELAGVEGISAAIAAARTKSRNALHNFFESIARKTTAHFRNVWKEYRGVEFVLLPDGGNLVPGVKEKNQYDFQRRSDGFKRFVSFLLLISSRVKSGQLSGALLLIDEPDISLHPSGARFLRDELIRIAKNNSVIYSTHSIFMIDREHIGRHLIVKKKSERTTATDATDSSIADEEVIFNALGHSIFESLKKKNLIFEGWKDKHLFEVALKSPLSEHKPLVAHFESFGRCHAKGVKHIQTITPMMELAQRECLIISDSDQPARENQALHLKGRGYGEWKRYDELLGEGGLVVTGEDFLKVEAFRPPIRRIRERHSSLPAFDEATLQGPRGKLAAVTEWLRSGSLDKSIRDSEIRTLKDELANNLKPSEVDGSYYTFLARLAAVF